MEMETALELIEEQPEEVNKDIMNILGWQHKRTPKGDRWSKDGEKTLWHTPNIVGKYDLFLKYCVSWMKEESNIDAYIIFFKALCFSDNKRLAFAPMNERVALFLVTFG